MHCLVTGGAGFIGSHLVDALLDRGAQVSVFDNLSTGRRENLTAALERGAQLHEGDIRDPAAVTAAFDSSTPELVFHLAAQLDVRYSVQEPAEDAVINVLGMITVLEAARARGVRRVVNSSSGGAVYGEADVLPTPEDLPLKPLAPYGQAKAAAEGYCALYTRTYGLSTISLRYANVYGPRQDPYGEGGVVAIFCGCLTDGRAPSVFGDGRQTRDWVEVSDVVRANLLAADSDLSGPVNIAHGQETSVLDLIEALDDISDCGRLPEAVFEPERQGEVKRSCLDVTRARELLGWQPTTELGEGLRRTLASM